MMKSALTLTLTISDVANHKYYIWLALCINAEDKVPNIIDSDFLNTIVKSWLVHRIDDNRGAAILVNFKYRTKFINHDTSIELEYITDRDEHVLKTNALTETINIIKTSDKSNYLKITIPTNRFMTPEMIVNSLFIENRGIVKIDYDIYSSAKNIYYNQTESSLYKHYTDFEGLANDSIYHKLNKKNNI